MMQCSSCGAMLRENYAFCRTCGAGIDHAVPVFQPEALPEPVLLSAAPPEKNKSTTLLVAAVAVMAALVLIMFLLVLEQQQGFIGLFDERQPAVTQDNNVDETTMPAEETQVDSAIQNQLGLPATPAMFYTTANLHLRAAPSTQAQSIVILAQGTRVNVIHYYSADWFRVQRGDDVGYMSSEFLRR